MSIFCTAALKEGQVLVGLYTSDDYRSFGVGFAGNFPLEAGSRIPASCYAGMENLRVDGMRFAIAESAKVHLVHLYAVTQQGETVLVATKTLEKQCSVGWTQVDFDTPITVDPSWTHIIPMYQFDQTMENNVIGTSMVPKEKSFVVYGPLRTDTQDYVWGNLNGERYGSVAVQLICASAPLSGYSAIPDGYDSRTVAVGGKFTPTIEVSSSSVGKVSSVGYEISLDGETVLGTATFGTPIKDGFNQKGSFTCPLTAPATAGEYKVAVTITAVNGETLANPATATYKQKVVSRAVPRMSVVEEYTGTACGWCTRGWVGMEMVKRELSDKACVIALHKFNQDDPMYGDYYHMPTFTGGAPKAVVDRGVRSVDPYYGMEAGGKVEGILTTVRRAAEELPEVAIPTLTAYYADEAQTQVEANAEVEFLTDLPGSSLVFVLTADGLTGNKSAWKQTNFYVSIAPEENGITKEKDPELYQYCWGQPKCETYLSLVFNDVMIGSSWPSEEEMNQVPDFATTKVGDRASSSYTLTLPDKAILAQAINKSEVYVTAMVLKADGSIANAARCRVLVSGERSDLTLSGVEATHVTALGSAIEVKGTVVNNGTVAAQRPVVTCTVNGGQPVRKEIPATLAAGEKKEFTLSLPTSHVSTAGLATVQLDVNWADGTTDAAPADNSKQLKTYLSTDGPNHRMVVEEGTGIWCGWCVRGIVAMRELRANYPERFVGIAIHVDDPMAEPYYSSWLVSQNVTEYPVCIVNRDGARRNPNYETTLKPYMESMPPYCDFNVALAAHVQGDALVMRTTILPLVDIDYADYRLVYVVTEDGFRAIQDNFYFDGNSGVMGGFESLPRKVEVEFTDIARGYWPKAWEDQTAVTLPVEFKSGEAITNTFNLPLSDFTHNDLNRCRAAVLVVSTKTGEVLNAAEVSLNPTGIHTVLAPIGETPAYNLAGQRVAPTSAGVVVKDGKKTILK